MSKADVKPQDSRCAVCQQTNCDVQMISCGCLLHTTCLPLEILLIKQPMRTNYANQQVLCPCCRRSPIVQIRMLPLAMTVLDDAARLRGKDNEILSIHNNEATSLACGSPANSIALFNGTSKRAFASKSSINRSYRTGRWASEESAYTDKLIKSFDAGLLPLPHGIKLNDFLCDLLSCRTSRLTKKLKNAKLSARTYRSWASGNTTGAFSNNVGGDIQRAQALFLKTITPEWVRMELQFNISRMWRTHLANFCLQISYLQLDTKEWFASLDSVDYIAMSCDETKLQARRKRMRSALTEDANAALTSHQRTGSIDNETFTEVSCTSSDKEGVFVGGLPFQRLSSLNLKNMADEEEARALTINTGVDNEDELSQRRERLDSLSEWRRVRLDSVCGSISKEADARLTSTRKFSFEASILEQSMKNSTSMSSFVELFNTPDMRPIKPPSRTASSLDLNAPAIAFTEQGRIEGSDTSATNQQPGPEVDDLIDEAVNSALESSSAENDSHGLFLKEVSKFLSESNSPFQHVDLWVPMDVSHSDASKHIGGSSTMATTSSKKVTGIIYGGQQASTVRLSNAGYITVKAAPQVTNRLNEFGMYSKNFSFSPGFGLPGRVYLSRIPFWETNLSLLKREQFARVGGAKIYDVNTCLSIPINTPIGMMVVALYSTQNLSRDVTWERKCMEYFWKLKPEPKWKLTIDVGLKTVNDEGQELPAPQCPESSPRIASAKTQAYIIPPSPTAAKSPPHPTVKDKKPSAAPTALCYQTEQSLALLIEKYIPYSSSNQLATNPNANNQAAAGNNLRSLHLLLLRHSSRRTNTESKMIDTIMGKYQNYAHANKKEHDLILSIASDWKRLSMLSSSINEAQPKTLINNPGPASKRVYYDGRTNSFAPSNFGSSSSSPMPSPSPASFTTNFGTNNASLHQPTIPSMNQFGDYFSLPLDEFGNNGLQNIANVASSISEQIGSRHQFEDQNNVPRVVSEQGPIEQNNEERVGM